MPKKLEARPLLLFIGAFLTVLFFVSGQASTAKAVTVTTNMEGSLIKGSAPVVYFVGVDNKRYFFPNEAIFYSWFKDFSTVKTVADNTLAAIPIGGDVVARAAPRLVKGQSDPKVYAIASAGVLQWVSTETIAQTLFGNNWSQLVENLSDKEIENYPIGAPINSASDFNATGQQPAANTNDQVAPSGNTNNNTNTVSNPDTVPVFKIVSVSTNPENSDATTGQIAPPWVFDIVYSSAPSGARLTVVEKTSGAVFYNEPIIREKTTATTTRVVIGNSTAKLKPSALYGWKVIAYEVPNATAAQTATAVGEFTTSTPASIEPSANTNVNTSTPPKNTDTSDLTTGTNGTVTAGVFKIVSVDAKKIDAAGKAAEDVRTFRIVFSKPPIGARLTITENSTGAIFVSESIALGDSPASTVNLNPANWPGPLKPNTSYSWKVTANGLVAVSGGSKLVTDTATGDFTTTDFKPSVTTPTS